MYSVETEVAALDEVAALPARARPAYAELVTLLEMAERKLEELLSRAWAERILIEVSVADRQPERPTSISVRRF